LWGKIKYWLQVANVCCWEVRDPTTSVGNSPGKGDGINLIFASRPALLIDGAKTQE
jgi:hypothetical protein